VSRFNACSSHTKPRARELTMHCTDFATITLTEAEHQWLSKTCPYLTQDYIFYLASYRFKPEQVKIKYIPVTTDNLLGHVEIEVMGPWVETILWEVPLMACLSESYFQSVFVDWNYDGQDGRLCHLCIYSSFCSCFCRGRTGLLQSQSTSRSWMSV